MKEGEKRTFTTFFRDGMKDMPFFWFIINNISYAYAKKKLQAGLGQD